MPRSLRLLAEPSLLTCSLIPGCSNRERCQTCCQKRGVRRTLGPRLWVCAGGQALSASPGPMVRHRRGFGKATAALPVLCGSREKSISKVSGLQRVQDRTPPSLWVPGLGKAIPTGFFGQFAVGSIQINVFIYSIGNVFATETYHSHSAKSQQSCTLSRQHPSFPAQTFTYIWFVGSEENCLKCTINLKTK